MKILISSNPITCTNAHLFPSIFLRSLSHRNPKSFHFRPKRSCTLIKPSATSFDGKSLNYGGWDDLRADGELINSGESTQLPDFLVSIGFDNRKYIFVFFLGIFCAFAVARVRVSSIILFPASVLIFGVGFSLGFFRGGSFDEFSSNASKKRVKDEIFRVNGERLKSLVAFFDGFDVKVSDLKSYIQRAIDTKEIELVDLENYVGIIDSIQALASNLRNVVECDVDIGNSSNALAENQRSSGKKKKEIGGFGFEFLQFVGSLFGEKIIDSKPSKVKDRDIVKQGSVPSSKNVRNEGNKKGLTNDQNQVNSSIQQIKFDHADNGDKRSKPSMFARGLTNTSALDWDSERRIRITSENAESNMREVGGNDRIFVHGRECSYRSTRLQFDDNQCVSWKRNQSNEAEMQNSNKSMLNSMDFNFSFEHTETESSFVREQMLKQSSGACKSLNSRKVDEGETCRSELGEEEMNDDSGLPDFQPVMQGKRGSASSVLTDDAEFDWCLSESNKLLKQAKECLKGRRDEEHAEVILYRSAKLLSEAQALKPTNLLAVGLLGNTYLLHGELKLKISRELRALLSRRDPLSAKSRGNILKGLDRQVTDKNKIASALINVCEECEELLVEAGRKYRLALSIDGNDIRALYNWGLALSFRAQLIADIGPEAAFDADKVFLAAIDKFDAMMSKGNVYAPDALYRWGVVLQQRSRLRPQNSKEKVKLLMQAKRLYEDALDMDFDNLQIREAITSCVAELNHRHL